MSTALGTVFSTADTFKRKLVDALRNPREKLEQVVGHANDRARVLNEMTAAAANEMDYGPASKALAGAMADAYSPAGMIKAPRDAALEKARKNAVKMLGLPDNNTPMDRAKALGFHTDAYRGTTADEKVARLSKGMMGQAHYSGLIRDVGNDYAGDQAGANVMPLLVRGRLASNREMSDVVREVGWEKLNDELIKRGFSGVADTSYEMAAAVKNPAAVRSRFAAFDPARVNENDLLGRASLPMLGTLAAGAGAAATVSALRNRKKEKQEQDEQ